MDSSGTFARDSSYLDFRARTGAPGWARWLAASWWKPATFDYRQSPRPLISTNFRVTLADPPLNVTGMVTVILDPEGRLREFVAVPPQVPPSAPEPPATPMWDVLLAEAGLDPKTFTRSDPAWLPSVPFDAIAGFTGPMPGEKDVTLRVVAAAFRGRPVSFQLVAPWSKPDRDTAAPVTLRSRIQDATFSLTTLLIAGAAVWFARRNSRLGRGDRRGAARIGTTVCACMFLVALLLSHPAAVWSQGFARPLVLRCGGLGILAWGVYLAFEPYFRRRYPELLVSWTRLIGGRWGDPLVGRDLLGGLLLGCGAVLVVEAIAATPAIFASGGETPLSLRTGGAHRDPGGRRRDRGLRHRGSDVFPRLLDAPVPRKPPSAQTSTRRVPRVGLLVRRICGSREPDPRGARRRAHRDPCRPGPAPVRAARSGRVRCRERAPRQYPDHDRSLGLVRGLRRGVWTRRPHTRALGLLDRARRRLALRSRALSTARPFAFSPRRGS